MTIQQLKRIPTTESRPLYCETKHEMYGNKGYRIIGIGRKYVRLMSPGGRILEGISPEDIVNVWF